jgi:cbb3-type cytochrome oxidase subunit 3
MKRVILLLLILITYLNYNQTEKERLEDAKKDILELVKEIEIALSKFPQT